MPQPFTHNELGDICFGVDPLMSYNQFPHPSQFNWAQVLPLENDSDQYLEGRAGTARDEDNRGPLLLHQYPSHNIASDNEQERGTSPSTSPGDSRPSTSRGQRRMSRSRNFSLSESATLAGYTDFWVPQVMNERMCDELLQDVTWTETLCPQYIRDTLGSETSRSGNYQSSSIADQNDDLLQAYGASEDNQTSTIICKEPTCLGKSFAKIAYLRRHTQEQHTAGSDRFVCGNCKMKGRAKAYVRRDKLRGHLQKEHDMHGETLWRCLEEPCRMGVVEHNQELHFASQLELDRHRSQEHQKECPLDLDNCCAQLEPSGSSHSTEFQPPETREMASAGLKHTIPNAPLPKAKRGKIYESRTFPSSEPSLDTPLATITVNTMPGDANSQFAKSANGRILQDNSERKHQDSSMPPLTMADQYPRIQKTILPLEGGHGAEDLSSICVATNGIREMLAVVRLHDVSSFLKDREPSNIMFDFQKNAITLSDSKAANQVIKGKIEDGLKEVRRLGLGETNTTASKDGNSRATRQRSTKFSADLAKYKIFPIDAKEDANILRVWVKWILPILPNVLTPLIGGRYSAALVKQDVPEGPPTPIIRIQSASGQSELIRAKIRALISRLCEEHGHANIPLQFSQGGLVHLSGSSSVDSDQRDNKGMDSEANNPDQFPHHKRYWKNVGMSASGGLLGCRTVTTTIGGTIVVDGESRLLTADHFLERSLPPDSITSESPVLTSPSLEDVDGMILDIDQTIRDIKAEIAEFQPMTLEDMQANEEFKSWEEQLRLFEGYRSELNRRETEFFVGRLDKRSGRQWMEARYPSDMFQHEEHTTFRHRLDWSTFKIESPSRLGENRHRHRFHPETRTVDFRSEDTYFYGAGQLCQQSGEIQPNLFVHYVGQASGRLNGQINAAPVLIVENSEESREWAIVAESYRQQDPEPDGKDYRGDSGAWVLRDSDTAVVGLLWGFSNGQLLLTPINTVFEHIRMTSRTQDEVRLPRPPNTATPRTIDSGITTSAQTVPICHVKEVQRMPRSYFRRSASRPMPNTPGKDSPSKAPMSIAALVNPVETPTESASPADPEERVDDEISRSSSPSLSFSPAISPKSASVEPSTPLSGLSAGTLSDEHSVIIQENNDDGVTQLLEGMLQSYSPLRLLPEETGGWREKRPSLPVHLRLKKLGDMEKVCGNWSYIEI